MSVFAQKHGSAPKLMVRESSRIFSLHFLVWPLGTNIRIRITWMACFFRGACARTMSSSARNRADSLIQPGLEYLGSNPSVREIIGSGL